jgi:hypothetical protein
MDDRPYGNRRLSRKYIEGCVNMWEPKELKSKVKAPKRPKNGWKWVEMELKK